MSEQKIEAVPWSTRQTFAGILFTLLPWIAFVVVLSLFTTSTGPAVKLSPQVDLTNAIVSFIFGTVEESIFLIAPLYFSWSLIIRSNTPWHLLGHFLGFRKFRASRVMPLIIVLFIGILLVNWGYSYIVTTFHLHVQTNDQVVLQRGRTAPLTTYATLLAAVIVAPFCEELFFRSFVLMGLLRDMRLGVALVLSALLFAVAHGDPSSFAVLFCIGLALAFLRWHTQSIWPGIILHMLNNGLSAVLIVLALR